jgi:hypothetical protein
MAQREADLRKEQRLHEKKQELLESDREEMKRKWDELEKEKVKF